MNEVMELIVPFKRPVYEQVIAASGTLPSRLSPR